jgi:arginyl-tRNA synthetase
VLNDMLDRCREATMLAVATVDDGFGKVPEIDRAIDLDTLTTMNLMVGELSSKRGSILNIDFDKMAIEGGYTGVSLYKWLMRLDKRLAGVNIDRTDLEAGDFTSYEDEDNPQADVLRLLVQFPGIVRTWVYEKLDPLHVCTFLFNVIDLMPNIWEEDGEAEGSTQSLGKLALYVCVRQTLRNGMRLLGLNLAEI